MFVVFLDIDGVLNDNNSNSKTPSGFTGIDNSKVKVLAKLVEYFDAKVVLTTTWKTEWNKRRALCTKDGIYLANKLYYKGHGIRIFDKTEDEIHFARGGEIERWLSKHPEVEDYIVLDDFEFDFAECTEVRKHVVKTEDGILTAHTFNGEYTQSVYEALQIINACKNNKEGDA